MDAKWAIAMMVTLFIVRSRRWAMAMMLTLLILRSGRVYTPMIK